MTATHLTTALRIRTLEGNDAAAIDAITRIDAQHTGVAKREHWKQLLLGDARPQQLRLVAENGGAVVGYVVGEVRALEFGSASAGWIYAVGVDIDAQGRGVGSTLVRAAKAWFAGQGIRSVRTMVRRDNVELLAFFRNTGFAAGPFVQLEASCANA